MGSTERTIVGVPFFEKEGQEVMDFTLRNVDQCLANLGVDASIVVMINGPDTQAGKMVPISINNSSYNADITLATSANLGQVAAINSIVKSAQAQGIETAFITDADIYRFPYALEHLWNNHITPFTGARHFIFPLDVAKKFRHMTDEEAFLYELFEADKHPDIQNILRMLGVQAKKKLKGSLLLIDTLPAITMHGNQDVVSDSAINLIKQSKEKNIVEQAVFMHWGRVSLEDYIAARVRHYKGAQALNSLDQFIKEEYVLSERETELAAKLIRTTVADGTSRSRMFLLHQALRKRVIDVCTAIVKDANIPFPKGIVASYSFENVSDYPSALKFIDSLLAQVDWHFVLGYASNTKQTTQEKCRLPIDISNFLDRPDFRNMVIDLTGVSDIDHM